MGIGDVNLEESIVKIPSSKTFGRCISQRNFITCPTIDFGAECRGLTVGD